LPWSFDSLPAFHTTDKCPALFPVSRFYRIGYNALAVLVMMLPPLPSLDPLLSLFALKVGKRSELRLYPYSIVKVLLFFQLYHPTKGTIVK
jgi:hypothetical protein